MVFEDSSPATGASTRAESRYLGEGFRHEPRFGLASESGTQTATETGKQVQEGATVFQPDSAPTGANGDTESTLTLNSRRAPAPNLDYVFDDPAEGEPGRDRMLVHGIWELVLAVAIAGVGYLLYREQSDAFGGEALRTLLVSATVLGALAVGSAVALRAGAVNLAVGAVAVASALYFGHNADGGLLRPLAMVIGVCAVIGVVQSLVIVGLHVPAWAASLGVGLVLLIWSTRQAAVTQFSGYEPLSHAYYWFGGMCAVSIAGALVGLVPSVRRAVGRFRPVADPAYRRGMIAALITSGAVVASTILAGIAGVLLVTQMRAATPSDGLELTGLALGTALLGGTSAFGRRGGIFGTVFAVALLTVGMSYADATGRDWSAAAFAAVAIGLGLAVTRLIEHFGRPGPGDLSDEDDEEWAGKDWQSTSSAGAGGIWSSDEAWGSAERR